MRIAIDIRKIGSKSTGDEVYTYNLVNGLMKLPESMSHDFLLLTDKPVKKIEKLIGKLPSNFKVFEITPRAKMFWTFYSLPKFLRKNRVDVLHLQYIVPFYLDKKINIITTIHDISFRVNPQWIAKKDSFLMNNFIPLTLKRVNKVITVSNFSKEEIIKYYHFPQEKIFVTSPAVDPRLFEKVNYKNSKKQIIGILKGDFPYILHISSMQPRKNVPLIIKAFCRIKEKKIIKNLKLILVGARNGNNYDQKIEESRENSRYKKDIIFPGYVLDKDLPSYYKNSLLFVFPSSYEGFGIPLLEAMVAEVPVIASNIGSFKEIDGGKRVVTQIEIGKKEEKMISELSKRMEQLILNKNLRKEIIKKGVIRAKEFSWENLARETLKIYEN